MLFSVCTLHFLPNLSSRALIRLYFVHFLVVVTQPWTWITRTSVFGKNFTTFNRVFDTHFTYILFTNSVHTRMLSNFQAFLPCICQFWPNRPLILTDTVHCSSLSRKCGQIMYEGRLKSSWTGCSAPLFSDGGGDLCQVVVVGVT
jgi:hypothetical protein